MTLTFIVLALVIGRFYFTECIKFDPEVDVGGDAQENEFPFMVQLQRFWVVSYLQQCGGSLITPSWILTAAHCNDHQPKLQVLAGTRVRNDRTNGQLRAVVRFIPHERYVLDGKTHPYDIALALVETPFQVDGVTVATVELWFVGVHFRPPKECDDDPAPVGTVCVGSPGTTACQGDSGGPVVGLGEDGIPRQIGVVSSGSDTCGAKPITCTDVTAYVCCCN
ncbi:lectizyme-like [Anopheles ziemanni]|uniref:lectizyme-like n=1 Tax=Anopheles coustani TaxID=139045 RepID=UPI002659C510|nr:lectizyme-like [Anopheles coustani]XP_058170677.1 lectizyme-like [Anopheles ziemanni]